MVEPADRENDGLSTFDELLPAEMASKAQDIGIKKSQPGLSQHFRPGGTGRSLHCFRLYLLHRIADDGRGSHSLGRQPDNWRFSL